MIVHPVLSDGTDLTGDVINKSVKITLATEDEDHAYVMNSARMQISNMNGIHEDLASSRGSRLSIRIGSAFTLHGVVDAIESDPDQELFTLSILGLDRWLKDKLAAVSIPEYWHLFRRVVMLTENGTQWRVFVGVRRVLQAVLSSIGLVLDWNVGSAEELYVGGLEQTYAKNVTSPVKVFSGPLIGDIYAPQVDVLPSWSAAELLEEVAALYNAYWMVAGEKVTFRPAWLWQDGSGSPLELPVIKDSGSIDFSVAGVKRVSLAFANAMDNRPEPINTKSEISRTGDGDDKEITSRFALVYAVDRDYRPDPRPGFGKPSWAVIPPEILGHNTFLINSQGESHTDQFGVEGSTFLAHYARSLKEVAQYSAQIDAIDNAGLMAEFLTPYRRIHVKGLEDYRVHVKEAVIDPHEELVEIAAGVYEPD